MMQSVFVCVHMLCRREENGVLGMMILPFQCLCVHCVHRTCKTICVCVCVCVCTCTYGLGGGVWKLAVEITCSCNKHVFYTDTLWEEFCAWCDKSL